MGRKETITQMLEGENICPYFPPGSYARSEQVRLGCDPNGPWETWHKKKVRVSYHDQCPTGEWLYYGIKSLNGWGDLVFQRGVGPDGRPHIGQRFEEDPVSSLGYLREFTDPTNTYTGMLRVINDFANGERFNVPQESVLTNMQTGVSQPPRSSTITLQMNGPYNLNNLAERLDAEDALNEDVSLEYQLSIPQEWYTTLLDAWGKPGDDMHMIIEFRDWGAPYPGTQMVNGVYPFGAQRNRTRYIYLCAGESATKCKGLGIAGWAHSNRENQGDELNMLKATMYTRLIPFNERYVADACQHLE